jgi:hypothetical protein
VSSNKPTAADVMEFVGRGVRAQSAVDAIAITHRVTTLKQLLEDAAGLRAARKNTNAATLDRIALQEVNALAAELAAHFDRFAR